MQKDPPWPWFEQGRGITVQRRTARAEEMRAEILAWNRRTVGEVIAEQERGGFPDADEAQVRGWAENKVRQSPNVVGFLLAEVARVVQ